VATIENSGKDIHIYYNENEYERLLEHAPLYRTRMGIRLQARSSPRGRFVTMIRRGDLFIDDQTGIPFVWIMDSKDTRGKSDGKFRKSWVPRRLYEELQEYCEDNDIREEDEIIDVGYKQYYDNLDLIGEKMAEETGQEFWTDFTTQDNRRRYVNYMYHICNIDINVIMQMGSWGSRSAIEPYLRNLEGDQIRRELSTKNMLNETAIKPDITAENPYTSAKIEEINDKLDLLMEAVTADDGSTDEIVSRYESTSWRDYLPDRGNHFYECEMAPFKEDGKDLHPRHGGTKITGQQTLPRVSDKQRAYIPPLGQIASATELVSKRLKKEVSNVLDPGQWSVPTPKRAAIGIPGMAVIMLLCGVAMATTGVHATADGLVVPDGRLVPLVLGSAIAAVTMLVADYRERHGTERWTSGI